MHYYLLKWLEFLVALSPFLKKFPTKNCLFGSVILTRNGYGIAFDEFPRNVVIIGVVNILRYSEKRKNNF